MHALCVQQHQPELYEAIMAQGREQAYLVLKEGISRALKNGKTAILEEGYEKGLKEGEERGKTAEREAWETKHGQGMCVEPQTRIQVDEGVQMGSTESIPMDSCTQTTPTCTVDAVMQTELQDEPLRPLRDAGMSTGTPIVSTEPPSPTVPSPQPAPLPATSRPTTYASHHTATSRLPMPLTMVITAPSPPSKRPPAAQKRRHSLPAKPTAPKLSSQTLCTQSNAPIDVATSRPPTPTPSAPTALRTVSRTTMNTQTATTAPDAATHAPNSPRQPSTAQQTELRDHAQTRSSERIVDSTRRPSMAHRHERTARTPPTAPSHHQHAPLTPDTHDEPPTDTATSQTRQSPTAVPPASHTAAALRTTNQKQRDMLPGPSECPRSPPMRPSLPPNPRIRDVSPPPASLTTAHGPESPPASVLRPPSLVEPHLSPVLPRLTSVPTRFDWAEDAESLPTTTPSAETYGPRDFSSLRSSQPAPFRTLRRRVRRRHVCLTQPGSRHQCFNIPYMQSFTNTPMFTHRHPSGIAHGKPVITIPFGATTAPAPVLKLDWDQDPCLVSLSQALCALGWTPPC
jgi:hypothetical protein